MEINNDNTEVVFRFRVGSYFLVHGKDDRFGENGGEPIFSWWLAPRIDRSYKGKDDDEGMPILYLGDAEAEACKTAGMTYRDETEKD